MVSAELSRDEKVRALIAQGVPAAKAEALFPALKLLPHNQAAPTIAALAFPLHLTLPWSSLCSDNFREAASLTLRGGKPFPRKVLTARYKAARDAVREIAKGIVGDALAVECPLHLRALVYVPDARPHDVCNFAKGVHDALEGIVYRNDRWLYRVQWERAEIDVDRPRAELTITPL